MSDKFKRNPKIEEILPRLKFFNDSYKGGQAYRDGRYLKKHRVESSESYNERLKVASFRNFCAPIVDIYTAYLYRDEPTREFGSIEKEVQLFLENADLEDRSWNKVVRELSKQASKYGMMGAIIDKPQGEVRTKADEVAQGMRPYIVPYSPMQFINYKYERINGEPVLTELILLEESDDCEIKKYRIWYRDKWELWEDSTSKAGGKSEITMIDNGVNNLGDIPFVLIKNRDMFKRMQGLSDIEDIVDINRRIYNMDGSADETIERTGYPFLELPRSSVDEGKTQIGTGNLIVRDDDEEKGAEWKEPPHTSLPKILEWREAAIEDIREMARTGKISGTQIESGIALELRFQQLNALLSEKAANMEHAENEVFRLFALWEGKTWDGKITYPRKFGIRDLLYDLDLALKANLVVPSRTFESEQGKRLAARILKDADQKIIDIIGKELETIPVVVDEEI